MICSKISSDRKQYLKLDSQAQGCCGSRHCGNTPKPTLSSYFADNLHCRAPTQHQNKTLPTHSMKTTPMHPPLRKAVTGLWNVLLVSFGPQFSSRDSISVSYKNAGIYLLIYLDIHLLHVCYPGGKLEHCVDRTAPSLTLLLNQICQSTHIIVKLRCAVVNGVQTVHSGKCRFVWIII